MSGIEVGVDVTLTAPRQLHCTAGTGTVATVKAVEDGYAQVELEVRTTRWVPVVDLEPIGEEPEPYHDGGEDPVTYPTYSEGDILVLAGDRVWPAVSTGGLVQGLLHPGLVVTYQGQADDGRHEVTVAGVLRALVPARALRPVENEGEGQ